jgi:hypothetical protein
MPGSSTLLGTMSLSNRYEVFSLFSTRLPLSFSFLGSVFILKMLIFQENFRWA